MGPGRSERTLRTSRSGPNQGVLLQSFQEHPRSPPPLPPGPHWVGSGWSFFSVQEPETAAEPGAAAKVKAKAGPKGKASSEKVFGPCLIVQRHFDMVP